MARSSRFIVLLTGLAASALVAAQSPPRDPPPPRNPSVPRTGTASIAGQVVLSSGEPVSDAEVAISSARGRSTATTGADGRFDFQSLPSGAYYLFANREDLLSARYGERIYGRGGRTIPLADGERREFRLTLPRRSTINGRVTDTSGRPVPKAAVRLVKLMPPALYGYPAARPWHSMTADAAGNYRFASVDPADYAVCASAIGYAVTCTPSTADSPQKITIAAEETRSDIDLALTAVRARRVEGVLNVPDGVPGPDHVFLRNVEELYDDPSLAARPVNGRFRFDNVPPGRYVIRAQSENSVAGVMKDVDVEDADLTGVVVTMVRSSTVAGRLEFRGALVPSSAATQPRLMLSPSVPGPLNLRWGSYLTTPNSTGAFVFPSVQPGTYRLSADYPQSQPWYSEGPLVEVRAGENITWLTLTMTTYRAEVTGTIVTARGFPAPEHMIVLYSVDPYILAASGRARADGTFTFRLKRPGKYRIGFIPDYDPQTRIGPDVLREIDAKATTVSVMENGRNTVRLVVPDVR